MVGIGNPKNLSDEKFLIDTELVPGAVLKEEEKKTAPNSSSFQVIFNSRN